MNRPITKSAGIAWAGSEYALAEQLGCARHVVASWGPKLPERHQAAMAELMRKHPNGPPGALTQAAMDKKHPPVDRFQAACLSQYHERNERIADLAKKRAERALKWKHRR